MPQEEPNKDFMLKEGVGYLLEQPDQLGTIIGDFLKNPALFANKRERALQLAQPHAALDLADYILEIVNN